MMYLTREERLLPLNSIFNTRDLGGYETQEGSFTKTHKYIRAATPAHLSEEDKAYLYNYGVRVIIDLRGENEILQILPASLQSSCKQFLTCLAVLGFHPV